MRVPATVVSRSGRAPSAEGHHGKTGRGLFGAGLFSAGLFSAGLFSATDFCLNQWVGNAGSSGGTADVTWWPG